MTLKAKMEIFFNPWMRKSVDIMYRVIGRENIEKIKLKSKKKEKKLPEHGTHKTLRCNYNLQCKRLKSFVLKYIRDSKFYPQLKGKHILHLFLLLLQ